MARKMNLARMGMLSIYLLTNVFCAHAGELSFWETRRAAVNRRIGDYAAKDDKGALFMAGAISGVFSLPEPKGIGPSPEGALDESLVSKTAETTEPPIIGKMLSTLSENGVIRSVHGGVSAGDRIVVLCQDIHGLKTAQEQIAAMMVRFSGVYPDVRFGVEGAEGELNGSNLRAPSSRVNRHLGYFLLRAGLIGGPEAAVFWADHPARFFGLEENDVYQRNVAFVRKAASLKFSAETFMRHAREALRRVQGRIYSPSLKQWDETRRSFGSGTLPLRDYISAIVTVRLKMDPSSPIAVYRKASQLESTLDFEKVKTEREMFINRWMRNFPSKGREELIRGCVAHQAGLVSYAAFHRFLAAQAERSGVRLKDYPQWERYIRYIELADSINADRLYDDIRKAERLVNDALCATPLQREVHALSEDLMLLEKVTSFSLSTEEWKDYKRRRAAIHDWPARIRGILLSAEGPSSVPLQGADVGFLGAFEGFNDTAEARDSIMAERVWDMTGSTSDPLFIVVGGFHTEGMADILTKRGATVIVVSPKWSKGPEDKPGDYMTVFTRDRTPLEKLFESPKLTLAATPALWPMDPASRSRHETVRGLALELRDLLPRLWGETSDEAAKNELASLGRWSVEGSCRRGWVRGRLQPNDPLQEENQLLVSDKEGASQTPRQEGDAVLSIETDDGVKTSVNKVEPSSFRRLDRACGRLLIRLPWKRIAVMAAVVSALMLLGVNPAMACSFAVKGGALWMTPVKNDTLGKAAVQLIKERGGWHPSSQERLETIRSIVTLNPSIKNPDLIYAGKEYLVQPAPALAETMPSPPLPEASSLMGVSPPVAMEGVGAQVCAAGAPESGLGALPSPSGTFNFSALWDAHSDLLINGALVLFVLAIYVLGRFIRARDTNGISQPDGEPFRIWEDILESPDPLSDMDISNARNCAKTIINNHALSGGTLNAMERTAEAHHKLAELALKTADRCLKTPPGDQWSSDRRQLLSREFNDVARYAMEVWHALSPAADYQMLISSYSSPQESFSERSGLWPFLRRLQGFEGAIKRSRREFPRRLKTCLVWGNRVQPHLYEDPDELQKKLVQTILSIPRGGKKFRYGVARVWMMRKFLTRFAPLFFAFRPIALYVFALAGFHAAGSPGGLLTVVAGLATGVGTSIVLHRLFLWEGEEDPFYEGNVKEYEKNERNLRRSASALVPNLWSIEYKRSLQAMKDELGGTIPTADVILLVATDEEQVRYWESIVGSPDRNRMFRPDVPIVVLRAKGQGSGVAFSEAALFPESEEFKRLAERYPLLVGRRPEETRCLVFLPEQQGAAGLSALVEDPHVEWGGRSPTVFELQLMNAYKASRQMEKRGGHVYVSADHPYVGPMKHVGGFTLLGVWSSHNDIQRLDLAVIVADLRGHIQRLLYRLKAEKIARLLGEHDRVKNYDFHNPLKKQLQAFAGIGIVQFESPEQFQSYSAVLRKIRLYAAGHGRAPPSIQWMSHVLIPLLMLSLISDKTNGCASSLYSYLASINNFSSTTPEREKRFYEGLFNVYERWFRENAAFPFRLHAPSENEAVLLTPVSTGPSEPMGPSRPPSRKAGRTDEAVKEDLCYLTEVSLLAGPVQTYLLEGFDRVDVTPSFRGHAVGRAELERAGAADHGAMDSIGLYLTERGVLAASRQMLRGNMDSTACILGWAGWGEERTVRVLSEVERAGVGLAPEAAQWRRMWRRGWDERQTIRASQYEIPSPCLGSGPAEEEVVNGYSVSALMQSPLSSNAKVARRHIEERVRRLERHPSPYPDVLIVHGLGPISGREVRRRLAGDFEGVAGAERYFERCRIFAQEDLRISVRDLRWKIDGELGLGGQFRLDLYVPDARDVILDGLRSSPLWNVFWMTEDGQVVNVLDFLDAEVRRGPLKDA